MGALVLSDGVRGRVSWKNSPLLQNSRASRVDDNFELLDLLLQSCEDEGGWNPIIT